MMSNRGLFANLRSGAGAAVVCATLATAGYFVWEHSGPHDPAAEKAVSAVAWMIPSLFFCLIAVSILRNP
ncbi:MAG TPA: hypothetical protein VLR94_07695, partial [Acidobacteriota bacterium]|nr:hypothetical protein [Acidobacteriota bacterium]